VEANKNIREDAGKEYNIVRKVNQGKKIIVISENNDWTENENILRIQTTCSLWISSIFY
jgi:hypothetical protein